MNFAKSLGRGGRGFGAENADFLDCGGIAQRFDEGGIQRADDLGRRAGGRDDPKPADGFESAEALLGQRWHVGQEGDTFSGGDPERLQLAVTDQLLGCGNIQHRQRDVAGKNVRCSRRGAAIGDQLNSDAGLLVEQGRGQVHRGAVAAMADRQALRLRLGLRDEVCDRGNRRLLRGYQHERDFRQQRDWRKILDRIERHRRAVEVGIDGQHAGRGHAERVAIRGCLRHGPDPDIAARARPVLDDDRLLQRFRQQRLQGADHDIGTAAGWKRHDDLDRLIRICVCCFNR